MPALLPLSKFWGVPLLTALALIVAVPEGRARVLTGRHAVATEHPLATQVGIDVLARGGNAVDAVIAAALIAGVVNPTSSGIGGGGFALVSRPQEPEPLLLDFRETAPAKLDAAGLDQRPLPPEQRGQLIGVPAEVPGLFELSRRFGKRPWPELVRLAETRARTGFAVGAHLARALSQRNAADLQRDPALAALFFPGGKPAAQGRVLKNPKLANTLRQVAETGPAALTDGPIAAEIVDTATRHGSRLSIEDLRGYAVRERKPLKVTWGEYQVFTMPPPSAGGLLLAQTLGMLKREELLRLGFNSGAYQHLVAEALRAGLADRVRHVGDPDHVPVPVEELLNPERLAEKRRRLSLDRTHTVPRFLSEDHGTHHLVVADGAELVVSLTTTVNRVFGAKVVTPESGIVLNDQLDDFTDPEDVKLLGLKTNPNQPRPSARPASSMTPTLVYREGRVVLALGGSGGMTIPTNVTQLLLGRLVFDLPPEQLLKASRFYVFPRPGDTILLEPGASPDLIEDLKFRGELVGEMKFTSTAVQLLTRGDAGWSAAADPRKFGSALTR